MRKLFLTNLYNINQIKEELVNKEETLEGEKKEKL